MPNNQPDPELKKLYPSLSDEELIVAEEHLAQYLALAPARRGQQSRPPGRRALGQLSRRPVGAHRSVGLSAPRLARTPRGYRAESRLRTRTTHAPHRGASHLQSRSEGALPHLYGIIRSHLGAEFSRPERRSNQDVHGRRRRPYYRRIGGRGDRAPAHGLVQNWRIFRSRESSSRIARVRRRRAPRPLRSNAARQRHRSRFDQSFSLRRRSRIVRQLEGAEAQLQ
jgi:hypothetical protein